MNPARPAAPRSAARGAGQEGSAYLATLLVLVVLTIIGLSLVLITQTEMQIGANERVTTRVFYAADAGVGIATARVLVKDDHTATEFLLRDQAAGALNLGHRVELEPFYPILDAPCNLCTINQGNEYFEINHAVTVSATRVGWSGGAAPDEDAPQLARKTVGVMVEIQPRERTSGAMEALALSPEELARIKW